MAVDGVNSDMKSVFETKANTSKKSNSEIGVNDFLSLIAVQLQSQDMFNPVSDTDFIAQMAQFTSLQAMENLASINNTAYSVGLISKEVTVAKLISGTLHTETGIVTGVGLYEGEPIIYIGDEKYSLSEIMIVGKMPEPKEEETEGTGGNE